MLPSCNLLHLRYTLFEVSVTSVGVEYGEAEVDFGCANTVYAPPHIVIPE
jgi:hypothetical protein